MSPRVNRYKLVMQNMWRMSRVLFKIYAMTNEDKIHHNASGICPLKSQKNSLSHSLFYGKMKSCLQRFLQVPSKVKFSRSPLPVSSVPVCYVLVGSFLSLLPSTKFFSDCPLPWYSFKLLSSWEQRKMTDVIFLLLGKAIQLPPYSTSF